MMNAMQMPMNMNAAMPMMPMMGMPMMMASSSAKRWTTACCAR